MINNDNNGLLSGRLAGFGVGRQGSTSKAGKGFWGGNLQIRGREEASAQAAATDSSQVQTATSAVAAAEEGGKSASQNFRETFLSRLEEAQTEKSAEETLALTESVMAVIAEIRDKFGDEAANQAMAEVLTATSDGVTGERIAEAIGGVLKGLSALNQEAPQNSEATAEETGLKLQAFLEYLNQDSVEVDGRSLPGLSKALNDYFGLAGGSADSQKVFGEDFNWRSAQELSDQQAADDAEKEYRFSLSVREIGRETMNGLANYLREVVGSSEAAEYIENLSDDADVFDAIDQVRNMFLANTTLTDGIITEALNGANEKWNRQSQALVGTQSLRQRVGPGLEQNRQLNDYLDKYMVDAANAAIRNDPEVTRRFQDFVTFDVDESRQKQNYEDFLQWDQETRDGYGLFTWPGARALGGMDDFYYGHERRTWSCGFVGDTTGEERRIERLNTSSNILSNFAQSTTNQAEKDIYQRWSDEQAAAYQELISAYRQGQTSGNLVDQTI